MASIVLFPLSVGAFIFFVVYGLRLYAGRSAVREALEKAGQGRRLKEKLSWAGAFSKLWGVGNEHLNKAFAEAGMAAAVGFLLALIFSGSALISFFTALAAGVYLPRKAAGRRKKNLQNVFRRQLGDLTLTLTSAVKNKSLLLALEYVIKELPPPIGGEGGELEKLVQERKSLGSMSMAAMRFAERIGVPEAYVLADSLILIDEVGGGGRADEVLSLAQEFARERERLKERVRQSSLVVRGAYTIAMLIPLGITAWLCLVLLPFREVLFSPTGRIIAAIGVFIELAGLFMIYRKINSVVNSF